MRIKKLLAASIVMAAGLLVAGPASADTAVPGQQGRSGNVTGHYTIDDYYGCDYTVNYRGDFGGDPYLDSGWIVNTLECDGTTYQYLIVHESDPRYSGDPDLAIWGTWEYHTLTESGYGNWVAINPEGVQ